MGWLRRIEENIEKRKALRREWKTPRERSIGGAGSQYDNGEELVDE